MSTRHVAFLQGSAERSYVRGLVAIFRAARLNNFYPNARRLRAHLECLSPDLHGGLYPGVEVDSRSGLPTYREWTRVQTDHAVAADALAQMRPRAEQEARARRNPASIYGKRLLKRDYYTAIRQRTLTPLSTMEVALRRVDPKEQTAWFNVVLDKLDVSGMFVRYTIDLAQTSSVWDRAMVTLSDDTAEHTEAFRSLIYQFTSFDAEFTFGKLVTLGGLTVERVVKGTVGPFYFPETRGPRPIAAILEARGGFVATFGLDMAACDIAEDRDNDPLDELLAARLTEQARQTYEQVKAKWGYKVFKDRKFVCARDVVDLLDAMCRAAGTRNIIYPA